MGLWILHHFSWTGLSCWPQTQLLCPAYSYNFQTRPYSFSFASISVFHPHLDQVHLPTGRGKRWRVQLSGTASPTWELIFRHLRRLTSIVLFLSFHLFVCLFVVRVLAMSGDTHPYLPHLGSWGWRITSSREKWLLRKLKDHSSNLAKPCLQTTSEKGPGLWFSGRTCLARVRPWIWTPQQKREKLLFPT